MIEEKEGARDKPALKPAQVAASALAAVTAAFLGSTLGVAGTVAGAGIASVVTTVGGEVYLRSLRKTQAAARRRTDGRLIQETRRIEPRPIRPAKMLPRRDDPTAHLRLAEQATVRLPRPTQHLPGSNQPVTRHGASEPTVLIVRPDPTRPEPVRPWWKRRWIFAVGASVIAFVVGMLAITGFESVTGHPLSGGSGTTIGRLGGDDAPTETSPIPERSGTVTQTPTRGPASATRTVTPSSPAPSPTSAPAPASRTAPSSVSAAPSPSASPTSP